MYAMAKCMLPTLWQNAYPTQLKDGPSFIKILELVYSSYTIQLFIFIKQLTFLGPLFPPDFILVEWKGILNFLFFLFLSCFLYHLYVASVLCCLSVFYGHITSVEYP